MNPAAAAGVPFVGIGRGPQASDLRAAGAGAVVADFTDIDTFLDLLAAISSAP